MIWEKTRRGDQLQRFCGCWEKSTKGDNLACLACHQGFYITQLSTEASAFFSFLKSNPRSRIGFSRMFSRTNIYSGGIRGRSWLISRRFPRCVWWWLQRWLSRSPSSPNFEWQWLQWKVHLWNKGWLKSSWSPNSTNLYFWYLFVNRQIQKT